MNYLENYIKVNEKYIKYWSNAIEELKLLNVLTSMPYKFDKTGELKNNMERAQARLYIARDFHDKSDENGEIRFGKYFRIIINEYGYMSFDIISEVKERFEDKGYYIDKVLINFLSPALWVESEDDKTCTLNYARKLAEGIDKMEAIDISAFEYEAVKKIIKENNLIIDKIKSGDIDKYIKLADQYFEHLLANGSFN